MSFSTTFKSGIFGNGGNWAFFLQNVKWIGEYVGANQLAAINVKAEMGKAGALHATAAPAAAVAARYLDLNIRGGILAAHLHFDGKIYMLNEKQWAEVSQKIVADCQAKLAKVKAIEFDDAMVLGSTFGR